MNLQLKQREDFSKGVLRLIEEEISSSHEALCNLNKTNMHEIIHALRKSFKKLRAILKLIRPEIGEGNYRNKNNFYRNLGKKIAEIRDYTALIEVLQHFRLHYPQQILERPLGSLEKQRKILEKEFLKSNTPQYLKKSLPDTQDALPEKLSIKGFGQIADGMKKVYKNGWNSLNMSLSSRSTEQLHEWRKNVKYLRYQLEILSRIWPRIMISFEQELHDLSDLLGFDHDLAILEKQIGCNSVEFENVAEQAFLVALIKHQRDQMQSQALVKGQNFYQDNPDVFVEKINTYWTTYHKQITSVPDIRN